MDRNSLEGMSHDVAGPEHENRPQPMRSSRRYSVIATFLLGGLATLAGCVDDPLAPEIGPSIGIFKP